MWNLICHGHLDTKNFKEGLNRVVALTFDGKSLPILSIEG